MCAREADAAATRVKPRGKGISIVDTMEWESRGNYSELVDCVVSRIQMEQLKRRIGEVFGRAGVEMVFRNECHCNDFYCLYREE